MLYSLNILEMTGYFNFKFLMFTTIYKTIHAVFKISGINILHFTWYLSFLDYNVTYMINHSM